MDVIEGWQEVDVVLRKIVEAGEEGTLTTDFHFLRRSLATCRNVGLGCRNLCGGMRFLGILVFLDLDA
jgi:hypothetical protein